NRRASVEEVGQGFWLPNNQPAPSSPSFPWSHYLEMKSGSKDGAGGQFTSAEPGQFISAV
ncbi:MAG: hypothetical protein ACLQVY_24355, partial [Limisphaerales bacterium]